MSVHKPNGKIPTITSVFLVIEQSLKSYLKHFLIRQQDIEDTVQETFLRAWEAEMSSDIESPKSYLFKVARNLALSEIARKSNKMLISMGDLDELEVFDSKSILEEELDSDNFLVSLNKIIGQLPPKCQTVLVMRKVYGFSHKEISKRLNISVKTVERHLTKGLKHCQNGIQQLRSSKTPMPIEDNMPGQQNITKASRDE